MGENLILSVIGLCLLSTIVQSQTTQVKVTDSNTALHLLTPDYPVPYGPAFRPAVAVLGWNAVQIKVNINGEVEGTCVGTGMSFDPAFYYNRPVNVAAAHGYGPVIMAGAEMIKLLRNYQVVINDAAVMFYPLGTDWKNFR